MTWPAWLPREGDVVERLRLDVKSEYASAPDEVAYDMAKDVAAMANAVGGRVIVGAREHDGVLQVVAGLDLAGAAKLKDCIERACRDRLEPAVMLDVSIIAVTPSRGPAKETDVHIVVAEVQASPGQPVGVRRRAPDDVAFTFPVRVGTHTDYFSPSNLVHLMDVVYRRNAQLLSCVHDAPIWVVADHGFEARATLASVDPTLNRFVLRFAQPGVDISVPISAITTLWNSGKQWNLHVEGWIKAVGGPTMPGVPPSGIYTVRPYLAGTKAPA